jgi:O-antigen/teichoic acid export membrane protein
MNKILKHTYILSDLTKTGVKMSKLNRFVKTSVIYMLGSVFSKLVSFFMLPLYTNKILPEQYGTYDLAITIVSFLAPIAFFQVWDGMLRYSFDFTEHRDKNIVISNTFAVMVFGIVIYSLLYIGVGYYFKFEYKTIVYLYGIVIAFNYYFTFISRVYLDNKLFVSTGLINTFVNASFNLIFILGFNMDVISLYLSAIIGFLIQIIIIEIKLKPLGRLNVSKLNFNLIRMMMRFSVPLCVASISYWLLSGYTKVVITNYLGAYENGMYSVATKFSSLIVLGVSIFQYAWNEMAYIISGSEDRFESYEYATNMVFKIVILFSGLLMLLIKVIFPFYIGSSYQDALILIPLAIIGVSVNSFAGFLGTIFSSEKKTNWIFWSTLFAAILNISVSSYMTRIWGVQGALGALALSFALIVILRLIILYKQYKIKPPQNVPLYLAVLIISSYLFYSISNAYAMLIVIITYTLYIIYEFKAVIYKVLSYIKNR